jgi:hypothetical protein
MKNLTFEATFETPQVVLDGNAGVLEFSGRSHPEDSLIFYKPILNWVSDYLKSPAPNTRIVIRLEYFNTSTSKMILSLLNKFENTENTVVDWFHFGEDEDMLECGKEFSELINLPFTFHTI